MRPRVLVTTSASWRNHQLRRVDALTGRNYSDALVAAGALPVMIASLAPELAEDALEGVHGLVFSGGADLDPARFGQAPHPHLGTVDPVRDAFELALYAAARRRRLPVLGICRGIQTIVVAEGGTLHQHLPAVQGLHAHDQAGLDGDPIHRVRLEEDSALAAAFAARGAREVRVNSFHHQAPDRIPASLRAVAVADDGLVEAVEAHEGGFVLGVQWHPEMSFARHPEQSAPFDAFAAAMRESARPAATGD